MIKVKNLDFKYDKTNIIFENFSLTINSQIFGLVGVNGAGKSTLLKLLVGLIKPKRGNLSINGANVVKEHESVLKQIGVLFENPVFPPWTVVIDHLLFVGQMRGLNYKEAYSAATKLLQDLDLTDKRENSYNQLSAGLKQRFGIAQALIGDPKVVLLDEPTANLDAVSRVKVLKILKKYSRGENNQIIILSHVLSDLEKFCDEYGILHHGNLVIQESITDLLRNNYYNEYLIRFTKQFELENITQKITSIGCEIVEENNSEVIVKLKSKNQYDKFATLSFPATISVSPARSLLEQVFFQKIEA